ncbi:MAG: Kelch repeat-containing protein [Candidatus Thorarchaeota archaeon]|jgi:N-acetylneuraminic acid mutarotase
MSGGNRSSKLVVLAASFYLILSLGVPIPSPDLAISQLDHSLFVAQEDEMKPRARYDFSMAYDSESDQVIIFGGYGDTQFQPSSLRFDTWSYDLLSNNFTEQTVPNHPPATEGAAMVYDSESDKVVLYTGIRYNGAGPRETWVYDYNKNSWNLMNPLESPFNERWGHSLAYDSESDRIILFGGRDSSQDPWRVDYVWFDDTWSYDLEANTWTKMNPQISPESRTNHRMAYDEESDRVILFGGQSENPDELSDAWAYDYNTDTWEVLDVSESPSVRFRHSMTYDREADRVVLVGGYDLESRLNDTWTFDYNSGVWTQEESIPYPSGVFGHDAVYHSKTGLITLFGGFSGTLSDAVWIYSTKMDVWFDDVNTTADNDDDELTDLLEFNLGTQWFNPDSDFDLMPDGWEYNNALDPLDPSDASLDPDNDGFLNLEEYEAGTDPHSRNSIVPTNPFVSPEQLIAFYSPLILIALGSPFALLGLSRYQTRKELREEKLRRLEEEEKRRRAFADLLEHATKLNSKTMSQGTNTEGNMDKDISKDRIE